ncbi:MAG TPA: ATP-binding protein [Verrucomicrobiae bacterium]|nr:ATP-binding protein [Verrucomicrobiae bacterium]
MSEPSANSAEIRRAFAEYDRQVIIQNVKVGCALGFILMPAGTLLDFFVYRTELPQFLVLRLACSLLIAVFWMVVLSPFGHRHPRMLGVLLAMFPSAFISWMIYVKDGSESLYYAGLNLVLLVIGFVLYWTLFESLIAVSLVLLMYVAACVLHGDINPIDFANNLYFLALTGVIVVTGSYVHSRWRFREFALRFELDRNRQALEESNRKLVELDQIKSRFFANISHELRTPLTLLIAPLETLLRKFNRSVDRETNEVLTTMHSNGMRLLKLINDLLDLVRMESGRMEVRSEPLEISDFVKGLASAARQVADDKRLKLQTQVEPGLGSVLADRDKLEKIVLNLVFNALKFTPSGGSVSIHAKRQDDQWLLVVADTGMGISAKNLPFIFDRFWQVDGSSKRKYQGVGIGLSLVKELAEVQGGSVSVESVEGEGTTFTVRLPYREAVALAPEVAQESAAEPDTSTVSSEEWVSNLYRRAELFPALTPLQETRKPVEIFRNGNRPKALVADDEPDMLRFLKSQLVDRFEVLEAVDGQQAIEKASQFLPEIILVDMMMPEKDGLQVCRELRERTTTQHIPIVMLTARADEETKMAALEAGASDFLPKPFSTTELHVRIHNLVESHQNQMKLSKQKQVLENTIDQLKETEMQLVQTEKLASLGRMSAGIIHEINNPLNFATTGLFTLRNKGKHLPPEQRDEYTEVLQDVEEGLKRVKTIVSDLRMFSHPNTEQLDDVEVAQVVGSALRFLSSECKDRVVVEQNIPAGQTIWANKNKLIHVITNLLQNAIDAMKGKTWENEQPTIVISGRVENGRSILCIRDNGPGIEREHLDKIFDPFFTTKDVGEGMGLGLSICYRIVQEYGGRIAVKTEPGRFCEFALEFPVKG